MTHRNTVKRCEETRQLMNSDFPRQHRYTGVCRVCLQAGQHLSGVGWGHCQANPSRPSILHLYDSRFSSGPSAARSLFWHSMGAHQSHAAVGCRLAKEQATQSMSNTPPVSFHNGHPTFICKVASQGASFTSQRLCFLYPPTTSHAVFHIAHRRSVLGVRVLRLS